MNQMIDCLLPISWHYWYWKCLWVFITGIPIFTIAQRKNRNRLGWLLPWGIIAFSVGIPGILGILLIATRKKLNMRMKYLTLKFEEDLAHALKLPSPVGNDLEKRILMVLANNPRGLRLGALAQGIGLDWRHIEDMVQKMLAKGKVKKADDRYFFNLE
jgi:hypothetical protein